MSEQQDEPEAPGLPSSDIHPAQLNLDSEQLALVPIPQPPVQLEMVDLPTAWESDAT